jgi:hypothetical protein
MSSENIGVPLNENLKNPARAFQHLVGEKVDVVRGLLLLMGFTKIDAMLYHRDKNRRRPPLLGAEVIIIHDDKGYVKDVRYSQLYQFIITRRLKNS